MNRHDMDIYYLYNSGFTVSAGDVALIFDYCRGSLSDQWRMPLPKPPDSYRQILSLSSHVHGDHYVRGIYAWLEERPDVIYILSSDIVSAHKKAPAAPPGNIRVLSPGEETQEGGVRVRAFGSTDVGVSFLVDLPNPNGPGLPSEDRLCTRGTRLFHAGDLNYWHWSEESTQAEIEQAKAAFTGELAKVQAACPHGPGAPSDPGDPGDPGDPAAPARPIDIAFFPVDPRMGADYYRGAVMFCEALRPKALVPMHFGAQFDAPQAFFDEIAPHSDVVRVGGCNTRIDWPRIHK